MDVSVAPDSAFCGSMQHSDAAHVALLAEFLRCEAHDARPFLQDLIVAIDGDLRAAREILDPIERLVLIPLDEAAGIEEIGGRIGGQQDRRYCAVLPIRSRDTGAATERQLLPSEVAEVVVDLAEPAPQHTPSNAGACVGHYHRLTDRMTEWRRPIFFERSRHFNSPRPGPPRACPPPFSYPCARQTAGAKTLSHPFLFPWIYDLAIARETGGRYLEHRKQKALELWQRALSHVEQEDPDSISWARSIGPHTWLAIQSAEFLRQYCFVVYASGMRYRVISNLFPRLSKAFYYFDIEQLEGMSSIKKPMKVFALERKARNFLDGAHAIAAEGFPEFKERISRRGMDALEELPGIGPVTKKHLAKNVGLADVVKDDRWLIKAAELTGWKYADEMVDFLAEEAGETRHVIDVAIWNLAKDGELGQ